MADEIDVSQAESDFLLSLRLSQRAQYQGQSAKVCVVSSAKSCSVQDNDFSHSSPEFFQISIEVTMKNIIRNKAVFALSLLFLSNITYSSEEKNKLDEVMLYFTLSQCSEYVVGTQHPDRTLDDNITTYLDYLRIDKKDISFLSQEIIKFKGTLPTLGLVLLNDNANRDKEVSFCAIA